MFSSAGMYSDLNPVFNEVCPPHHMDENIFQQHQHMAPPYPQQYNSPADPHNQQMPLVPYGAQANDHREFSPGMSGSAGDLRNMGIPSHVSNDGERHFSPSPGGGIGEANKPENSWMVTTSHIDMRTVTPPNAVVTHSMLHQSPGLTPGQNHSVASISHTGFPHGAASSSTGSAPPEQKPRLTKSGKPRGTPGRKRKVEDHELSPEEAAKRRLRRERNKLAAAKCRNRRRELTDRLQGETDILEDHQGMLTQEIFALQQEKDHLEFILASHSPVCKVLQDKSLNLMGNQSPKDMQCLNTNNDCMTLHNHGDHGANLVNPMNGCMTTSGGMREQATTVSVIQAGPSLNNTINSRGMNENIFPQQGNSVIVGNENMMHGSYAIQADDLRSAQEEERRFPATLANLDVLDQVVAGEPLNTPVCTLSTPSNTTSVFTFPNTPCATSNSMANNNMNFNEAFTTADYSSSQTSSVMSGGNFLHPGPYPSSSIETCSQAHRRSSSSESHHSPDSVQSPTLLSL